MNYCVIHRINIGNIRTYNSLNKSNKTKCDYFTYLISCRRASHKVSDLITPTPQNWFQENHIIFIQFSQLFIIIFRHIIHNNLLLY